MISVDFKKSNRKNKKLMAIFKENGKLIKIIHFGALGYEDYTTHKDPERRRRYINRHWRNENWKNPYTAGSLSYYILWFTPDLETNINIYKEIFNFI